MTTLRLHPSKRQEDPGTVVPTTPGQPERILVRAILYKGTVAVGQPSDPTYVTVNP